MEKEMVELLKCSFIAMVNGYKIGNLPEPAIKTKNRLVETSCRFFDP